MDKQKILLAGKIASQVREYAKTIVKKNIPLLEIAEKIEKKIIELKGKPAFPTNLSIDNIAAHYTPFPDDKTLAHGLLKIDFGVQIDGWISDTAFSVDLENSSENKKLIQASEDALKNAIELIKNNFFDNSEEETPSDFHNIKASDENKKVVRGVRERRQIGEGENPSKKIGGETTTSQMGKVIQQTIESHGFSPIINLSGHSMEKYDLHSGITVPNVDEKKEIKIKKGLYAIEPFATTGSGKVHDSKLSGIYALIDEKNPRSQTAREILEFIKKEYQTLPFCSRWIIKKFGAKAMLGLRQLEENGNLHHFPQLVESSDTKVSQAEHTIFIDDKEIIVTTE